MSDTPRTDAAEIVQIFVNHPELRTNRVPVEFARQLERELSAAKDGWRDEICKAQADMRRAETMLNDERKHRAEAQADYRCLAELLDGHDATECRANLSKLKDAVQTLNDCADYLNRRLAEERALADRLAGWMEEHRKNWQWHKVDPSCDCEDCVFLVPFDEALAAWKEARHE